MIYKYAKDAVSVETEAASFLYIKKTRKRT